MRKKETDEFKELVRGILEMYITNPEYLDIEILPRGSTAYVVLQTERTDYGKIFGSHGRNLEPLEALLSGYLYPLGKKAKIVLKDSKPVSGEKYYQGDTSGYCADIKKVFGKLVEGIFDPKELVVLHADEVPQSKNVIVELQVRNPITGYWEQNELTKHMSHILSLAGRKHQKYTTFNFNPSYAATNDNR